MTDLSLRLPSTIFRAVLNLGEKRAAKLALPEALREPELDAEWDEETKSTIVLVDFEEGQLHLEVADDDLSFHYHDARGEGVDASPFSPADTEMLLAWATVFATDVHRLMPDLESDAAEAAAWHDEGYTLYVCETDPAQLDLLEVEIEGEMLTLPWLGAGRVDQQHVEGDDHPIELLWTPGEGEPDQPIARAWLDPEDEEPRSAPLAGVDWTAVGMPEDEVASWLEGIYLNHHVIEDPASSIFIAALERLAGIDREDAPGS